MTSRLEAAPTAAATRPSLHRAVDAFAMSEPALPGLPVSTITAMLRRPLRIREGLAKAAATGVWRSDPNRA
ncbi:hypothetical protein [Agromyces sp. NPDC049794]|uniref:hypothetical protein n=1 Tax=unclassified Agromyces TaxID=2639701 RepID=UPI0033E99680